MPIQIVQQDITRMQVDAIVSPLSPTFWETTELSRLISSAAGPDYRVARRALGRLPVGQAAFTQGFALPCHYVLHTTCPQWRGGQREEEKLLRRCYRSVLELAVAKGCRRIAIPLLCAGDFPWETAQQTAADSISSFLMHLDPDTDLLVYLVLPSAYPKHISRQYQDILRFMADMFHESAKQLSRYPHPLSLSVGNPLKETHDPQQAASISRARHRLYSMGSKLEAKPADSLRGATDSQPDRSISASESRSDGVFTEPFRAEEEAGVLQTIGDSLFSDIEESDFGACIITDTEAVSPKAASSLQAGPIPPKPWDPVSLAEALRDVDESFSQMLFRLIDAKGMTDPQCYKQANISKQHFSKIRKDIHYQPTKATAVALGIALRLTLPEMEELLHKAGLALTRHHTFDLIIRYFLLHGEYDIHRINLILFEYDQMLLGNAG